MNQIQKMGGAKSLLKMLPGIGQQIKDIDLDEKQFKSIEAIIQSMTPMERQNPEIIHAKRRTRIANGSGSTIKNVAPSYQNAYRSALY